MRQQATRVAAAQGLEPESVPASATVRGDFTPPLMFGRGLVEAITDETILAREDPDDPTETASRAAQGGPSNALGRTQRVRVGYPRLAYLASNNRITSRAISSTAM